MSSISYDTIKKVRREIRDFFESNDQYIEFPYECRLEDRKEFISKVLRCSIFSRIKLYSTFVVIKIIGLIGFPSIKILIYRLLGVKIGKGVYIAPEVLIDPTFPNLITIEDYCIIGWRVNLLTHEARVNSFRIGRVTIKRGAVIGAFSTVRAGVTIGEMSQTPMNSFIYKDIKPYSIVKTAQLYEGEMK
jgi:acetyltransferase-like isoleucine patch superfamily enzyme